MFSPLGTGEAFGGADGELGSIIHSEIPLKVVATCTLAGAALAKSVCILFVGFRLGMIGGQWSVMSTMGGRILVRQGTDSIPTNVSIAALEQKAFLERGLSRTGAGLLYVFCQHHQAALCKKPVILKFPGLATGSIDSALGASGIVM